MVNEEIHVETKIMDDSCPEPETWHHLARSSSQLIIIEDHQRFIDMFDSIVYFKKLFSHDDMMNKNI